MARKPGFFYGQRNLLDDWLLQTTQDCDKGLFAASLMSRGLLCLTQPALQKYLDREADSTI